MGSRRCDLCQSSEETQSGKEQPRRANSRSLAKPPSGTASSALDRPEAATTRTGYAKRNGLSAQQLWRLHTRKIPSNGKREHHNDVVRLLVSCLTCDLGVQIATDRLHPWLPRQHGSTLVPANWRIVQGMGQECYAAQLDVRKAFDHVCHGAAPRAMEEMGVKTHREH